MARKYKYEGEELRGLTVSVGEELEEEEEEEVLIGQLPPLRCHFQRHLSFNQS